MGNIDNLKGYGFDERTASEQREIAKKGGIASGEARREKANLRRSLETLLEDDITDRNGKTLSGADAISTKLFEKALKGNTRAFEIIRDTVGQKPVDRIQVQDIDQAIVDEVEAMVLAEDLDEVPVWNGKEVSE